jgi:hypothetical protein
MRNPFKRNPKPENPIAENLQAQFHLLESKIDLPPELKNAVFNTVQSVNLTSDVVDLFTTTFLHSGAVFIDILRTGMDEEA